MRQEHRARRALHPSLDSDLTCVSENSHWSNQRSFSLRSTGPIQGRKLPLPFRGAPRRHLRQLPRVGLVHSHTRRDRRANSPKYRKNVVTLPTPAPLRSIHARYNLPLPRPPHPRPQRPPSFDRNRCLPGVSRRSLSDAKRGPGRAQTRTPGTVRRNAPSQGKETAVTYPGTVFNVPPQNCT